VTGPIPPEAVHAAAEAIHKLTCPDSPQRMHSEDALAATAALEAAEPHIRAAIYAELGSDHYVIFTEDSWAMEHSVECRLRGAMAETCEYWKALQWASVTDHHDPGMLGRWRVASIDGPEPALEHVPQG
jgi:hypothetical protein